jgi:hypothetical protein
LPIEPSFRVQGWKELAAADFPYDTSRYYALRIADVKSNSKIGDF